MRGTCCEKGQKRRRWWCFEGDLQRKRAETSQVVVFRGVPAAKRVRNVAGGGVLRGTCSETGQKRRRWFRIIVGGEGDEKDAGAAERRGG